ncbi:hypothetical protein HPP92_006658, partial [Vanilla planifolia]
RYCSARLRRLYRSLKFKHGRGKFVNNEITVSTITEVRYLHILLYMAERAWSHAMEKRHLPDGPNARQHIYLLGRLRKAVKWATLFAQFSAIKGDSRTSLEAEVCFGVTTEDVYEELGKYGSIENQILCRERVEELQPSIKYCLHKVGDSNMQTSELLDIGDVEGPALDLFKVKLEAVMAEARSQQAASMTEFYWLGHKYPINNAKTRVSILKALELEKNLNGPAADSLPAEKQLPIYDRIFSAYQEARACIRSDLAAAGSADNVKVELNGLDKAVSAALGQRTIERNQLLINIAKSKITKQRDDKSEKITKPRKLVRLFDLLIQNATDLYDLVSSQRNINPEEETFAKEFELKGLAFRAERCFYLAKSYSSADEVLKKLQTVINPNQVEIVDDEMKSGIMNALRVLKQTWLRSISIAGCSLIKDYMVINHLKVIHCLSKETGQEVTKSQGSEKSIELSTDGSAK